MRTRSSNTLLTAVLLVLTLNLIVQLVPSRGNGVAQARVEMDPPAAPPSFPNNAELVRRQSEQLADIASRLSLIEAALNKPLQVKVIEMPAMAKDKDKGEKAESNEPANPTTIIKPVVAQQP